MTESAFWERVDKSGDCWIWLRGVSQGYGIVNRRGLPPERAHRVAYELCIGKVPKGLSVCHKCDNPRCVRPDHLFLGTQSQNIRDCIAKGRWHPQIHNKAKTHCVNGHIRSEENTRVDARGFKYCIRCKADRSRDYPQGKKNLYMRRWREKRRLSKCKLPC